MKKRWQLSKGSKGRKKRGYGQEGNNKTRERAREEKKTGKKRSKKEGKKKKGFRGKRKKEKSRKRRAWGGGTIWNQKGE